MKYFIKTIRLLDKLTKLKRLYLVLLLFLQIITGSASLLIAWLTVKLIDLTIIHYNNHLTISSELILFIFYIGTAIAIAEIITLFHNFLADYFQDYLFQQLQAQLLYTTSIEFRIDQLEDSKTCDNVTLAKHNIQQIASYFSVFSQMLAMVFSLIFSSLAAYSISYWIPLLLIVTLTPLIYYRTKIENHTWQVKERYGYIFTQLSNLDKVLTNNEFAKEIRVYNIQSNILEKWNNLYNKYFVTINDLKKKGMVISTILSFLTIIGPVVSVYYILTKTMQNEFSIGQLAFLLGVIIQFENAIKALMYSAGDILKVVYGMSPLISLLSNKVTNIADIKTVDSMSSDHIILNNVSFKYINSKNYILQNINLRIRRGEKIAIVGANGAGKSTLIKLLCGFYKVDSGTIYWNNANSPGSENLYNNISSLFQDFGKFPLSLRENIDISNKQIPDNILQNILKEVGLEYLCDRLNEILSTNIENGINLSGGEWQRLALARVIANISNRELLLLDEPTAAIDPNAEYEILNLIKNIMCDKTTIIVSHRLSLTQFVDRIIVMEKGQIIESGNHIDLLALKGNYYNMYQKQASWYS